MTGRALAWLALLVGALLLAGPLFRAQVREQRLTRQEAEHARLVDSHYLLSVWPIEHNSRLMERIEERSR